jgi:hypothetical protein
MITLTARHGEEDELKDLLGRMKRAKRRLHQHRAWKRIKPEIVAKPITATEVTYGRNGWHPHFHMLVIVETDDAAFELEGLGNAWRGALRAEGLSGAGAAFDCQGATEAGQYVGKWGAGEELTLSGKKRAKGKGKTPLQLLEAHKAGNPDTGQLWLEYVEAFRGRTQLDGLKALVDIAGLDDLTDAEAALDQEQEGQEREEEPIANIDNDTWRERGRIRRTDILDAAESNGAAGVWSVIDGVTVSNDLAQPPPPRPGGLIDQLLDDLIESVSPP